MNVRTHHWGVVAIACWLALLAVPGATAQTAAPAEAAAAPEDYLEEIIVTARKRGERLQDLPGSAAALTSGFLEDIGGIEDLRDLTDLIPGITITESQDRTLSEPSIRGAGQSRNRMSVSATGIYRNDAYIADKGIFGRNFARFDTFDLERVEVLRGAQGALYGRNALGGAINLIAKRPEDQLNFELGVSVGELDWLSFEGIANVPITEQLFARVSYVTEERDDGFFDDVNGDPVDTEEYDHVRAALRYLALDEALEVNYVYDYMEEDATPGIAINRRPAIRALRGGDDFQTLINTTNRFFNEVENHSLQIDYHTSRGTVTSVTNLRQREPLVISDTDHDDNTPAQATRSNRNETFTDAETFFQELRFVAEPSGPFMWMVGADYYSTETFEDIDVFFPSLAGTTLALFGDPTGNVFDRRVEITQDSWALYGALDYTVPALPELTLSGELRYAVDDVEGTSVEFRSFQGCPVGGVPCTDIDAGDKFTNVPWTVTASWSFAQERLPPALRRALIYAKVASSYRQGGLNLSTGLPSDRFQTKLFYDEETSLTYEIGAKTSWFGNRLTFNGAAFLIDYEDFLDTTTNGCPELCTLLDADTFEPLGLNPDGTRIEVDEDGNPGVESGTAFFIDNIGEVEVWGVELEAVGRIPVEPTGGTLVGSLGWSRQLGEVQSVRDDISPASQGLEGERLNRLRPKQLKASLRYRQPLPFVQRGGWLSGVQFAASATLVYEEGGFRNLNTEAVPLDEFTRVDARLGLDAPRWSLFVTGDNITDENYVLWQNTAAEDSGRFRRNTPEYYALEFTWRYR